MNMRALASVLFLSLIGLAACNSGTPAPDPHAVAVAAATTPADEKLAKLYVTTCKACHGTGAGGAPLTGDRTAWEPRLKQGDKVLLEHAIGGYKGMPPMGSCADCTEAEMKSLINFMAGA